MNKKLIALDIDGTLLSSSRGILPSTMETLEGLHENGHIIVLASGRAYMSMQNVLTQISHLVSYAISSNGATIFDENAQMIFAEKTPEHIIRAIFEVCESFDILPEICIDGQNYASAYQLDNLTNWGVPAPQQGYILGSRKRVEDFHGFVEENINNIDGMDVLTAPLSIANDLREKLSKIENLSATGSSAYYIDTNTEGVNKAFGLEKLVEILGMSSADVIAFGDAENDIEIVRYAGFGVAMGNACDSLKESADFVTADNDSDGIKKAIEMLGVL